MSTEKLKIAGLTQVRDEPFFLPIWLKYYSKQIDDLYVNNHGGKEDYIEDLKKEYDFTSSYTKQEAAYDHVDLVRSAKEVFDKLLKKYDYVLYADVDEFIVPKYMSLREYLKGIKKDQITCTGREVVQMEGEKPIDIDKPLLKQRTHWWDHIAEFKTTIANKPLDWELGFHSTKEMKELITEEKDHAAVIREAAEPDLYMIHINTIDADLFTQRGRFRTDNPKFTVGRKSAVKIEEWAKEAI